jgi:hypothetical protein
VVWSRKAGSVASDGAYLKATQTINGELRYLKLSAYDIGRGVYGYESANEAIAERLGHLLGFDVPEGELLDADVLIEGSLYNTQVYSAKSFKLFGESRSTFEEYYRDFRVEDESPVAFCLRQGWSEKLYQMFIFDYLIINRDRHGANLEVLKSSNSVRLSPLLDNGISFLSPRTEPKMAEEFNPISDIPVNNFIGDRSLEKNLDLIQESVHFNKLNLLWKDEIFRGVRMPDKFIEAIWYAILRRWENIEKFRVD